MVSHIQAPWQKILIEGQEAFSRGEFSTGRSLFNNALSVAHEQNASEEDIGGLFMAFGHCLVSAGDLLEGRQRLNQALHTFERCIGPDAAVAHKLRSELAALDPTNQQQSSPSQHLPPQAVVQVSVPAAQRHGAAERPKNGHLGRLIKSSAKNDPTYDEIMAGRPARRTGPVDIDGLVHPREKVYGFWTALVTMWVYALSALFLVGFAIAPLMVLAGYISAGIYLGHLRSRAIKVSPRQFPEVYDMVDQYSTAMNMPPPQVYVVQEHGLLNALANRLHRKDIIVIYSDVVELAYEMGEKEMAFVVCHELAHIKRGHIKMAWRHLLGDLVPFLGNAYSRACEYTCDRVAAEIVPDGALFGLVCLAAGTRLYKRINLTALYEQAEEEWGFWAWFSEIQSTHPNLMNRIRAIGLRDQALKDFKVASEVLQ